MMRVAKDESKEGGLPSRPSNCALHILSGVTGETAQQVGLSVPYMLDFGE